MNNNNNAMTGWDPRPITVTATATCSAPTTSEFSHSNVTTSSAQLSTTASGNQFQFRYKPSSASTWTTTTESASTAANISSLSANTAYDYQVRRRCTNNVWSDWSATRSFTTTAATCSAPTTSEFSHSNVTTSSAQLSTTASGNQFQFRYKPSSGSTWTTTTESASTAANISSLSANTAYDYQVRRRCTNNVWSDWSATRSFSTTAATCSAPTTSEFSHSNVTTSSAQLSTTASGNQFQFRYKPSSASTWTTTTESTSTAANISSLSANTAYDYQIRRRCTNDVWSDWSAGRTFSTTAIATCSAPTTSEFSHSNVTTSSAQLSTTASGNQFQFRYKPSSASTWTTTTESASTAANISSLSANTAYDYQVRRRCTNDVWSDWSAGRTFSTTAIATCSAPTTSEFSHSNVTTSSAQLSTTASGNQFQFRYKPSSASTWTTTTESASTAANISSLSENTAYDYQVRRRCTNDVWSDWSAGRTFSTTAISTIPWTRITTGTNHTIIAQATLTATLDGTPLVPGDAIGFFFEHNGALHCSNYLVLTGQNQSVAVYGNDAGQSAKNGFDNGETFKVKIYKAATQQVHDAQVNFAPAGTVIPPLTITHTNTFAANGISLLTNLNASTNSSFRIVLNTGWNMISSHTLPADANMPAVFSDLTSVVEVVKDVDGDAYFPVLNINGLGNWDITKGYQVRSAADTALTIIGAQVDPAATPVAIDAGWQIIPYLRTQSAPISEQLASITGIIELVKDNLGTHTYIPGLINSIGDMHPGQGYQLKASASGTLTYPPNQLWSNPTEVQNASNIWERALPVHFEYQGIGKSCHNSTLVIRAEVAAAMMEPGDEIGVFTTNGILCGAAVFEDRHFAVTIWGDDPATPGIREGLLQGEVYQLRIWKRMQNSEMSIAPVFTSGDQAYHNDDIEILSHLNAATAVKESSIEAQSLTLFPNPTDGRFYVMLPAGIEMLELRDAKGALLQRMAQPAAGPLPIETAAYAKGLLFVSAWDATGRRWLAKVVLQ